MKKLIYVILFSLSMASCGNNLIKGNIDEYSYQKVEEKENIIIGFSTPIMLYHSKTVIYKDSTLRYIDCEDKDSVVKVIAKDFCPIKIKDIYEVKNIDTTYNNVVWYNVENDKIFYDNTTREILLIVHYINEETNDILDKNILNKYYNHLPNTIDEYIKNFNNYNK